jgi:hypothetical protein
MAAVVVDPAPPADLPSDRRALTVFPGSATPSVFPAETPFWVGSAFVPTPDDPEATRQGTLHSATRFELAVDGKRMQVRTDVRVEDGDTIQKLCVAVFDDGLPAGWHHFAARWYVGGKLVLSNDKSIEFVER